MDMGERVTICATIAALRRATRRSSTRACPAPGARRPDRRAGAARRGAAGVVSMRGCSGSAAGRHLPGCRVALLRRLLTVRWGPVALVPVPLGLAPQRYTQVVHARPTLRSMPLRSADLGGVG